MMRKVYYNIIMFLFVISASGVIFTPAPVPAAAANAKTGGKIPVYEAVIRYSRMWDTAEVSGIGSYQSEFYKGDQRIEKMLEARLADKSPAYEVMLEIGGGLPVMFVPASAAERDFISKNFTYNSMRSTVKEIAAGAKFLVSRGKCFAASRALLTAYLLSSDFEAGVIGTENHGLLLTKMVTVACRKICLETLARVILNGEFAEAHYINFYKTLEHIDRAGTPMAETVAGELSDILSVVRIYASLDVEKVKEFKDSGIYPPEVYAVMAVEIKKSPFALKVVKLYADESMAQLNEVFSKYNEAFKKPFPDAAAIFGDIDKKLTSGGYNNLFTQLLMPNLGRAHSQLVRNLVISDMIKIACLLKKYKLANKKFPEKLSDLASAAAGLKVPKDVFTAQDFVYRKLADDRFILASAGSNMHFDGTYDEKFDQASPSSIPGDDIIMNEKYIMIK